MIEAKTIPVAGRFDYDWCVMPYCKLCGRSLRQSEYVLRVADTQDRDRIFAACLKHVGDMPERYTHLGEGWLVTRKEERSGAGYYVIMREVPDPVHRCDQCNRDMGNEWLLGPVCGKCCRANHRRVAGGVK